MANTITTAKNTIMNAELFCDATGVLQIPQILCLDSILDPQLPHSSLVEKTAQSSRIPATISNGQTNIPMTPVQMATRNKPPPLWRFFGVAPAFLVC